MNKKQLYTQPRVSVVRLTSAPLLTIGSVQSSEVKWKSGGFDSNEEDR